MLKRTTLLVGAIGVVLASPAAAHRAWLLPSTTILSDASQGVTVEAAASTDPFNPDHRPISTDGIRVWSPDGAMGKIENASTGNYRSVFDVKIDKPGTWRIGTATESVSGRFKLGGESWLVGRQRGGGANPGAGMPGAGMPGAGAPPATSAPPPGSAQPVGGVTGDRIDPAHVVPSLSDIPAGATDLDLTEIASRNEFFVTAGTPTDSLFKPTNKGLEMLPVTHPTDLVANEPGRFRFLIDGQPAAGLTVTVVPGGQRYRDGEQAQLLTTGSDGTVTVPWPVPGFYWLNATMEDAKPTEVKASKRRMSYTATLEVLAP